MWPTKYKHKQQWSCTISGKLFILCGRWLSVRFSNTSGQHESVLVLGSDVWMNTGVSPPGGFVMANQSPAMVYSQIGRVLLLGECKAADDRSALQNFLAGCRTCASEHTGAHHKYEQRTRSLQIIIMYIYCSFSMGHCDPCALRPLCVDATDHIPLHCLISPWCFRLLDYNITKQFFVTAPTFLSDHFLFIFFFNLFLLSLAVK